MAIAIEIAVFTLFSLIAIGGALGMTTTMSMFRSGIFLMVSFIGTAGLFILLLADLLALLQVMMYIGGMLVMILFMLLFSHDPGGEMMTSMMKLPILEKFFSLGLTREGNNAQEKQNGQNSNGHEEGQMGGHDEDMSMMTSMKRPAMIFAVLVGVILLSLILLQEPWPEVKALPDPDSPARIGHLLMGKYMLAFEGAGLLILLGIFGAVYLSRPSHYPDASDRGSLRAAVEAPPTRLSEKDQNDHHHT